MTGDRRDLSDEECRRLVARARAGHLAFTRDALPAIAPVRFAVDGDRIAVVVRPGDEHRVPGQGAVVVLGVDEFDGRQGWAVSVVGPARTVTDPAAVRTWDATSRLAGPVPEDRHGYVVLHATVVRGWRTVTAPLPVDGPTA